MSQQNQMSEIVFFNKYFQVFSKGMSGLHTSGRLVRTKRVALVDDEGISVDAVDIGFLL